MIIHHTNPSNFLFVVSMMSDSDSTSVTGATPSRAELHAPPSREEVLHLTDQMEKIMALLTQSGTAYNSTGR